MFTPTLIHVAILAYFLVPAGQGFHLPFHAAKKAAANMEEKVVLRESTLSEKCGLGLETVVRPDEEIVALQASASRLQSALAWSDKIKGPTPEKPCVLPYLKDMKDRFVLICDGEKGIYFAGMYYPTPTPSGEFFLGCRDLDDTGPVKCLLISPTGFVGGTDNNGAGACSGGTTQGGYISHGLSANVEFDR